MRFNVFAYLPCLKSNGQSKIDRLLAGEHIYFNETPGNIQHRVMARLLRDKPMLFADFAVMSEIVGKRYNARAFTHEEWQGIGLVKLGQHGQFVFGRSILDPAIHHAALKRKDWLRKKTTQKQLANMSQDERTVTVLLFETKELINAKTRLC